MRAFPMPVFVAALVAAGCGGASSGGGTANAPSASVVPTPIPSAGQMRTDARGVEQVWVPAGTFDMGTDASTIERLTALEPPAFVLAEFATEQPQHQVRLTHGYWIDRFEVTNAAFKEFVDAGGYAGARDRGTLRLEGRDYVMADGDVLTVKFTP